MFMKKIIAISVLMISLCLNAQGISEKLSQKDYYENVLGWVIANNSLEIFDKPINNGYLGQKYSNDNKYITTEYKLVEMDRLLVVKNSINNNINKVILVISPVVKGTNISFETDKSVINYLTTYAQIIERRTKWRTDSLIFEHLTNDDGIGTLIISSLLK